MSTVPVVEATVAPAAPPPPERGETRRRFTVASGVGAVLGALVFTWMVTIGTFDLTDHQFAADFYDAQAHSFTEGRLDVDPEVLTIEAFIVDGRAYMYQGPVPALLRLPVAAVTDGFDGRLTQLSMILAFGVAACFVARLHWKIRGLARADAPIGRGELVMIGGITFAATAGSSILFLASRAWVYHEASMWGVALTLGALDAVLGFVLRPTGWRAVAVGGLIAAALLSRVSVALGALAAAGLVLAGALLVFADARLQRREVARRRLRGGLHALAGRLRWLAPTGGALDRRLLGALVAACVVPVALYATVNYAKFDTFFGLPSESQTFTEINVGRQEFLEANDGSFFGAQFAPTTALQYLRPDAIDFDDVFPFVTWPDHPARVIGDVRFDLLDRASSLPASTPMLTLLALGGALALAWPARSARQRALGALRPILLGSAVGGITVVGLGYIAQRYLADFLPFLVVGALVGLHLLWSGLRTRRAAWARAGIVAVVVLGVFSFWANLSLGLSYQRAYSPNVETAVVADWVGVQQRVDEILGDGVPGAVASGEVLPDEADSGDLFVIGDCDGLYLADDWQSATGAGLTWIPVEQTAGVGRFHYEVEFVSQPEGTVEPVLAAGPPGTTEGDVLLLEHLDDETLRFGYRYGGEPEPSWGEPFTVDAGETHDLDIVADRNVGWINVWLDGRIVFATLYGPTEDAFVVGENVRDEPGTLEEWTARRREIPEPAPICEEISQRAGLAALR